MFALFGQRTTVSFSIVHTAICSCFPPWSLQAMVTSTTCELPSLAIDIREGTMIARQIRMETLNQRHLGNKRLAHRLKLALMTTILLRKIRERTPHVMISSCFVDDIRIRTRALSNNYWLFVIRFVATTPLYIPSSFIYPECTPVPTECRASTKGVHFYGFPQNTVHIIIGKAKRLHRQQPLSLIQFWRSIHRRQLRKCRHNYFLFSCHLPSSAYFIYL